MSLTKLEQAQKDAKAAYDAAKKAFETAREENDEFRKWRKVAFFVLVGAVVLLSVITSL
jgi:ABC-type transport system involved in cytochrome bd biosynthesis fused ATPase/permease subunit